MSTQREAVIGEYLAVEYLKSLGYNILFCNLNYPSFGELDIVAYDNESLVIVEVKTRTNTEFGHPVEAVTKSKIRKILKATECLLYDKHLKYKDIRFDIVCVLNDNIEHIKDAFYGYWN